MIPSGFDENITKFILNISWKFDPFADSEKNNNIMRKKKTYNNLILQGWQELFLSFDVMPKLLNLKKDIRIKKFTRKNENLNQSIN